MRLNWLRGFFGKSAKPTTQLKPADMEQQQVHDRINKIFSKFSFRGALALTVTACVFGYLFVDRIYGKTGKTDQGVVIALITLETVVLTYYFGASKDKSDADKRSEVDKILNPENKQE